jgi:anti-anti-sigma factor
LRSGKELTVPEYVVDRRQTQVCVTLTGDLTAVVVPGLQADLRSVLEPGVTEVEFDLAGATLLDSSGIGLLIAAANSAGRLGGRLTVTRVSAEIFQLLQSMRLTARLNVTCREEQEASRG